VNLLSPGSRDLPRPFSGIAQPREREATRWTGGEPKLELVQGDLIREAADAIVNPVGAGLVDLAVRKAAGPELLDAYHRAAAELPAGRLLPGQSILTPGFRLAARHVIHTRPPVYADDPARARRELAASYQSALRLAAAHGLGSIAFPAVATGVYRYPLAEAADVAIGALLAALREGAAPTTVRFVLTRRAALEAFIDAARRQLGARPVWSESGPVFAGLRAA
jgi:O-acetyl-ADP-ribose deacetylase (regulator of RNase III)